MPSRNPLMYTMNIQGWISMAKYYAEQVKIYRENWHLYWRFISKHTQCAQISNGTLFDTQVQVKTPQTCNPQEDNLPISHGQNPSPNQHIMNLNGKPTTCRVIIQDQESRFHRGHMHPCRTHRHSTKSRGILPLVLGGNKIEDKWPETTK